MLDLLRSFVPEYEEFFEEVHVAGERFYRAGYLLEDPVQGSVYGSATDSDPEAAKGRAAAELLERIAIVQAMANPQSDNLPAMLFPVQRDSQWSYARSNGVAFALTRAEADLRAQGELIEREITFRSWYGSTRPVLCSSRTRGSAESRVSYSTYHLGSMGAWSVCVSLLEASALPGRIIHGFGAAQNGLEKSAGKAEQEALQRFLFLFDEEFPEQVPAFSADADFHQDYYLTIQGAKELRAWLTNARVTPMDCDVEFGSEAEIQLFEITPLAWQGRCAVVKAWHPKFTPLRFGRIPPEARYLTRSPLSEVHPIC